jgi:hypothetical protein
VNHDIRDVDKRERGGQTRTRYNQTLRRDLSRGGSTRFRNYAQKNNDGIEQHAENSHRYAQYLAIFTAYHRFTITDATGTACLYFMVQDYCVVGNASSDHAQNQVWPAYSHA